MFQFSYVLTYKTESQNFVDPWLRKIVITQTQNQILILKTYPELLM